MDYSDCKSTYQSRQFLANKCRDFGGISPFRNEYERLFSKLDSLKSATSLGEMEKNRFKAAAATRGCVSWVIPFLEDFNAKKNAKSRISRQKKRGIK